MKLPFVLLATSVVANTAFVAVFAWRPSLAPTAIQPIFESSEARQQRVAAEFRRVGQEDKHHREVLAARDAAARARTWSELSSGDLKTLVQRLREAGFPPRVIRGVVTSEISRRTMAGLKALTVSDNSDTEYWKPRQYGAFGSKLMEERMKIYRDEARTTREVLGDDLLAAIGDDIAAMYRNQFGNLSKDKIEMVRRISEDYREMTSDVRAAMRGITLPEDREKLALLEREQRADLAAVLTPEELADYDMRTSNITGRLRPALALMDASEQEFRAIYDIQKKYQDILYPQNTGATVYTMDMQRQREEATTQVNDQITAALGEARAKEFFRDSDFEFQQITRLTNAQNLPLDSAVKAYDLRTAATQQAAQIGRDTSLPIEQRMAAMQQIAQQTKAQLITTLGTQAGNTYAGSAMWLQAMEHGTIVTFRGTMTMFQQIPPVRK